MRSSMWPQVAPLVVGSVALATRLAFILFMLALTYMLLASLHTAAPWLILPLFHMLSPLPLPLRVSPLSLSRLLVAARFPSRNLRGST